MHSAEKISITLPTDMVQAIREKVDSGAYASTSEVVMEAMRLWQRREREQVERIGSIRERIERSLADPPPSVPLEEAFDRIERLHDERMKAVSDES
jgi:antitoxin ParD1/3/4